ncbi:30S ribosomal protein S6e [Candidatus Woesearchaeota archaeon]|nr:30S ribosomal protein S6e [Candidatus Woesearchaeota archaeon]
MVEVKITLNDVKNKKSYTKIIDSVDNPLKGKKIGEKVGLDDLPDYEFEIRGGSDSSGFPMRKDIQGVIKRKIFSAKGVGLNIKGTKGMRKRKTVAGNTINEKTAQINLKTIKYGSKNLEDYFSKT